MSQFCGKKRLHGPHVAHEELNGQHCIGNLGPASGKPVQCKTADEALAQAVAAAAESASQPGELRDALFGRFADLDAGWWWRLEVTRLISSEHPGGDPDRDPVIRRVKLVVDCWRRACARYEEEA